MIPSWKYKNKCCHRRRLDSYNDSDAHPNSQFHYAPCLGIQQQHTCQQIQLGKSHPHLHAPWRPVDLPLLGLHRQPHAGRNVKKG